MRWVGMGMGMMFLVVMFLMIAFSILKLVSSFRTTSVDRANPWPRRLVGIVAILILAPILGLLAAMVIPPVSQRISNPGAHTQLDHKRQPKVPVQVP